MPEQAPNPRPARPTLLIIFLLVLAGLSAAGSLLALVGAVIEAVRWGVVDPWLLAPRVGGVLAGWAAAGVLCSLAWIINRMHLSWGTERGLHQSVERLRESEGDSAPPAPEPRQAALLERIAAELTELHHTMLMSDEQRTLRRQDLQDRIAERLGQDARAAIESGDFSRAGNLLDRLAAEVPDDPRLGRLRSLLDEARIEAWQRDLREAGEQVEDLLSAGSYAAALTTAEELLKHHPSSVEAIALVDRVKREQTAQETGRRRRLYEEIERHVQQRDWGAARDAAERFLDAYPTSSEAELVTAQMTTLRENARIQEVRRMRDEIRGLLSGKHYAEALRLAREVVAEHPDTAAAADLRQQMPRLEQLAAGKASG